ncbi:hypothetical protein AnigIFM50267_003338 [Aspergillus niger]|nr:hypothetical protein AnigIFM50267_003338 [Aspergillus niger]
MIPYAAQTRRVLSEFVRAVRHGSVEGGVGGLEGTEGDGADEDGYKKADEEAEKEGLRTIAA